MTRSKEERSLLEALAEPFPAHEVKFKAQMVRANRALAVAYVDARAVEDRLDAVFGVDGWQDAYQVLPNNSVLCTLRVKVEGGWVERSDVGSQSDQPDEGDRLKSAFSDALKRAAVKLGIGRYLYRLPQQWVDYDPQKRQLVATPLLPVWARPRSEAIAVQDDSPITSEQYGYLKGLLGGKPFSKAWLAVIGPGITKAGEIPARVAPVLDLAFKAGMSPESLKKLAGKPLAELDVLGRELLMKKLV